MVQPHLAISAALIAAVIALSCKNCNAGIARFDDIIDDIDASDRNGLDRAIKPKALKWLKKQVKKLNKAMDAYNASVEANTDDLDEAANKIMTNKINIELNRDNTESNEEDISDNADANDVNIGLIAINANAIENFQNMTLAKIAKNREAIANNTNDIQMNANSISDNARDIDENEDLMFHDDLGTVLGMPIGPCNVESIYEPWMILSGVNVTLKVIDGLCLSFSYDRRNFNDSQAICEIDGGHLYHPRSEEQQEKVLNFTLDLFGNCFGCYPDYANFWVGINDFKTEGDFVFSDGSSLDFENWYEGSYEYPSGNGDCVYFDSYYGGWFDQSCSYNKRFACEFKN